MRRSTPLLKELLANHIKTCVADDIRAGRDETIDELVCTLQKLMGKGDSKMQYDFPNQGSEDGKFFSFSRD